MRSPIPDNIRMLVFLILSWLCAPLSCAAESLTVAVASSLYPQMQQQARAFEASNHVTVRLVPGSTGRLYNQIMQGAPYDLFVAADKQRPSLLRQQGRAIDQSPAGQGYLGVRLGKRLISDIRLLTRPSVRHIAIANPDVAPFGRLARNALQQRGLWSALQPKLVYAQNAMQAAMMAEKGLVDAGLVPLNSPQHAIASLDYQAVLLSDTPLARSWLKQFLAVRQTRSGGRED